MHHSEKEGIQIKKIMDSQEHEELAYIDVWPLKSTTEPSLRTPFASMVPKRSRHCEINSSE